MTPDHDDEIEPSRFDLPYNDVCLGDDDTPIEPTNVDDVIRALEQALKDSKGP